jgi:hypothetical protein
MLLTQMVNTRKGGGIDLPANPYNRRVLRQQQQAEMNPPNPPPVGADPIMLAQMRIMQQMVDPMADIHAQMRQKYQEIRQERVDIHREMRQEWEEIRQERRAQQQQQQAPQPPPPPPVPPWGKHREFMSHRPPNFSNYVDPLQADDWLKSVEKMPNIAQCPDREKVLYASGRLTSPAADWWDVYCAAHAAANTITWAEFSTQFRNYHIPAGLMKIKRNEFLSLKQGSMSVSEYRDRFIQLSRYAPRDVEDDEKKQELFLDGLIGPLQYQLVSHTFPSFQRLLDKAIAVENKRCEFGEKRRGANQGQAGSSSCPRYSTTPSTPACGSSEQPTQQTQTATPQASTPAGPISPNTSTNRACFKCEQPGHYANYCPNRATYTTPAPMKQGQASAGKSQPLSVNRGQADHAEVEVEHGELEIQEVLVEDEVIGEEVNEQQE